MEPIDMKKLLIANCSLLILAACGGTTVVDLDDKEQVSDMSNVMELEYRDWTKTAELMTDSMLKSGGFAKVGDPIIAIGRIANDTMQRFDTDILTKKIRTTLINSGRAQIATSFQNQENYEPVILPVKAKAEVKNGKKSAAIEAEGYQQAYVRENKSEDDTTHQVRNLRKNDEYDQKTVAAKGTLSAPNLSLTGKMIQRNLKLDSGMFSSKNTRVEYYLQLTLTNVRTGLSVWEDEQPIVKEGKNAPTW
jgi:PBP1b-binding outer membrane lipoprotein LpoB